MQTGLSLTDLARTIEAQRNLKQDYIVPTEQASMIVQGDSHVALSFDGGRGSVVETPILTLAHRQIGDRLGIPAKYYDRMRETDPDLLATNVNAWFRHTPEKRMVRTLGGDARAFLSNRYQRIENEEIAEVALPVLMDIPDVKIVSTNVTPHRMYIQAVAPRVQGDVRVGDTVQAGVIISNSEVGSGSVSVSAVTWRLVCLNGMVAAKPFRAYHVGRKVDDTESLWADDTRQADDRAVLLKVRDMVRSAVDADAFRTRLDAMRELADGSQAIVRGDPVPAVEVLAAKVGANDTERGGILRSLIEGGDLSAWGLINAVTAQAHTVGNYDRAVEFEAAGGRLLEMSRKEWREVLTAGE